MPVAGIWKSLWLPYSETFIRDQIVSVPDWRVVKLGFTNMADGIDKADFAPYSKGQLDLVRRKILGTRPYKTDYVRELVQADARLLHAHFGPGGVEALPVSRAAKLPLVTTFHGSDAGRSDSIVPWLRLSYRRDLGRLFEESTKLIAVSSYVANMLVNTGAPIDKIEVLHTGTKPTALQDVPNRAGIVFVGRLIDIKGPMDLLRAVSLMPSPIREETPVTIIGGGPLRKELEAYARDKCLRVQFLGRLDSDAIPAVLRAHSLFCGPSLPSKAGTREGFGMVFVEAALQQLPCIGYASGGVKEAVQHEVTGLLAPEGDIATLSKYLFELLTDSSRREALGIEGRLRALRDFNLEEQATKLGELYNDIA